MRALALDVAPERSADRKAPWKVQVHPKTGDVYVLCEDWAAKETVPAPPS